MAKAGDKSDPAAGLVNPRLSDVFAWGSGRTRRISSSHAYAKTSRIASTHSCSGSPVTRSTSGCTPT